jgi:isopenicillin N synthase-like dioxygenase
VGPFLAREPGALACVGQDVRQALEDIGFFFIKNHGVPQELIDRVFAENVRFHAQPLARKGIVNFLGGLQRCCLV